MLVREKTVKLLQEALDVRPEDNRLTLEGHAREGGVRHHLDWLLELVEQETKRLEAALAETVQHGRAHVICDAGAAEGGARATRLALLLDHQHRKTALRQQAGRGHSAQASPDHDHVVRVTQESIVE